MNPHNTTPEQERRHRRAERITAALHVLLLAAVAVVLYLLGSVFLTAAIERGFAPGL